jgi:hypothetical protein
MRVCSRRVKRKAGPQNLVKAQAAARKIGGDRWIHFGGDRPPSHILLIGRWWFNQAAMSEWRSIDETRQSAARFLASIMYMDGVRRILGSPHEKKFQLL